MTTLAQFMEIMEFINKIDGVDSQSKVIIDGFGDINISLSEYVDDDFAVIHVGTAKVKMWRYGRDAVLAFVAKEDGND